MICDNPIALKMAKVGHSDAIGQYANWIFKGFCKGALAIRRIFSLVDMITKPKGVLAIRRIFSLVDMITKPKF